MALLESSGARGGPTTGLTVARLEATRLVDAARSEADELRSSARLLQGLAEADRAAAARILADAETKAAALVDDAHTKAAQVLAAATARARQMIDQAGAQAAAVAAAAIAGQAAMAVPAPATVVKTQSRPRRGIGMLFPDVA